jgi:DNA-binding transcriptional LysR family regulator
MEAARRAGAGLSGALRVTFVASAAREILPAILRTFREQYPEVELMLTEAMTAQQVAKLQTDEADIGFVIPPLRDADGLNVEVLMKGQMVAALPEQHRLAQSTSVALSDLASDPWIIFPARQGPGLHERVLMACALAGFAAGRPASLADGHHCEPGGRRHGGRTGQPHHRHRRPARRGVPRTHRSRHAGRIRTGDRLWTLDAAIGRIHRLDPIPRKLGKAGRRSGCCERLNPR